MKKADLLAAVLSGELLTVVEFRGSTATHYEANAKTEQVESIRLQHRIELKDGLQQTVTQYLRDEELKGFDVEKYNKGAAPFKKGEKAIWHVKGYAWTEKGQKASGTLEKLDD